MDRNCQNVRFPVRDLLAAYGIFGIRICRGVAYQLTVETVHLFIGVLGSSAANSTVRASAVKCIKTQAGHIMMVHTATVRSVWSVDLVPSRPFPANPVHRSLSQSQIR